MKIYSRASYQPIDLSKVETFVYHLPDGPALSLQAENIDHIMDITLEVGDICDTSDIDGVIHFFPKGNA